ncbi:MAG: HIT family protein [Chitinophagales bacterium]|jgi:histidine triad (HIT) family protein
MASIFTRIVNGEIPCYKIAETTQFLAFLDVTPRTKGHTLCIPKQEIDYLFDMPDELLGELMIFSKKVAKALQQAVPCKKVGVAVVGLEVPHTHIHLMPMQSMADFGFGHPPVSMSGEELKSLANNIASFYQP